MNKEVKDMSKLGKSEIEVCIITDVQLDGGRFGQHLTILEAVTRAPTPLN
jgi:hypothetical protein